MKKIVIRIFIVLIILCNLINTTTVQASDALSIWQDSQEWLDIGADEEGPLSSNLQNAEQDMSNLAGLFFGIGLGVAVIVLVALGISYFLASTSDAKAEIKQKTIVVIVGLVLLLGSLTIWRVLVGTLSSGT